MYFSIPLWISLHSSVASESPLKSLRPSFNVLRQGYVFQHTPVSLLVIVFNGQSRVTIF